MITAIRNVRRAKGLTLEEVARRCDPPTTAQTVGRLEMGTRTVSVAWLNRIATALEVSTADLVSLPEKAELQVVAILGTDGAQASRHPRRLLAPDLHAGMVGISVVATIGDYRVGDQLWCETLHAPDFAVAMNRDVLVPRPGGRFTFGRLIGRDSNDGGRLHLLPLTPGSRQHVVSEPTWIARPMKLVRSL